MSTSTKDEPGSISNIHLNGVPGIGYCAPQGAVDVSPSQSSCALRVSLIIHGRYARAHSARYLAQDSMGAVSTVDLVAYLTRVRFTRRATQTSSIWFLSSFRISSISPITRTTRKVNVSGQRSVNELAVLYPPS